MKTLYLGYYDYPYIYDAYTIKDNKFVKYEMSKEDLDLFTILIFSASFSENEKKANYVIKDEENSKVKLNKYFKEFDRIIACEDGFYYLLK